MAATTGQLGLVTPTQGTLSGTWGDTVNNGITEYTNIAIAATLTLTNDGAVTLANTTGDASASNIVSSLTGAGTVTAQFAIVKVTGTLTTPKIITAPSYSKTYVVVNAATGSTVSFIRAGQTPAVSIAVGESAFVYYNGTDYVKVSSTVATGVTSFTAGTTGLTPNTATTGAVTLAGTLATANGGTNLGGATPFTANGVVYASSTSALATGSVLSFDGTNLGIGTSSPAVKLHVSTSSTSEVLRIESTSNPFLSIYNSGTREFYLQASTNIDVWGQANKDMRFGTNDLERVRITSAGNVGIGTSSPLAVLDVRNTSPNVLINGKDTADPAIYFGRYQFAALSQSGAKIGYVYGSASGAQEYGSLTFSTATTAFGAITERARITSTGGFVVGTTTDPGNGIVADINGNVRTVPQSGAAKSSSYTLATTDVGEFINVVSGGAIVIPNATFATGDVITIFNNTASTATITCSITTAYIAGTATDKATMTLAAAGVATILFIDSTSCVVSGNVT